MLMLMMMMLMMMMLMLMLKMMMLRMMTRMMMMMMLMMLMLMLMLMMMMLLLLMMMMMLMLLLMMMMIMMIMMIMMMMMMLRPCTFWACWPAVGRQPLKSGQGPPGRVLAVRQFSPLRRREGPRPLPATNPAAKNPRVLRCFVLVAFFLLFRRLWLQMGQHGPT